MQSEGEGKPPLDNNNNNNDNMTNRQEAIMVSTPPKRRPNQGVTLPPECPPPPTRASIIVANVSASAPEVPALSYSSPPLLHRRTSALSLDSFFSEIEMDQQHSFDPGSSSPKAVDRFFAAPQHAGFPNIIACEANAEQSSHTIKLKPRPSRWSFAS